jgi:putative membrane fusion protein
VVASVYKGEIDDETQHKLAEINRRINEISTQLATDTHLSNDAYRLEESITSKVNDIIMSSNSRDAEKVASLRDNLTALALKRVSASSQAEATGLLAELKAEKQQLESTFNASKTDILSPAQGIYSTNIDGYEQLLSTSKAQSMTVADYQIARKSKPTEDDIKASGAVCKVIDNYKWTLAALVNDNTASELETGKRVYIRFPHDNVDLAATVDYISPESSNKYVVVLSSTENCSFALGNRFVEFDLICEKYTGIKVPVKALTVNGEGATGVYVMENSAMRFKKAEVLFKDGKNAIVYMDNTRADYLFLYDNVITHAKEYAEGKKID